MLRSKFRKEAPRQALVHYRYRPYFDPFSRTSVHTQVQRKRDACEMPTNQSSRFTWEYYGQGLLHLFQSSSRERYHSKHLTPPFRTHWSKKDRNQTHPSTSATIQRSSLRFTHHPIPPPRQFLAETIRSMPYKSEMLFAGSGPAIFDRVHNLIQLRKS